MAVDEFGLPIADDSDFVDPNKKDFDLERAKNKGKKLLKKAQKAGKKFVEFRNKAKKAFGEMENRSEERFNPFGSREPVDLPRRTKKSPRQQLVGGTINPFGPPTNESIGLLRPSDTREPLSERLRNLEKRMSPFGNRKGQATIEAIFAIFVFAVIGYAILPIYYDILNNFLIPAIQNQAFGSLQVIIWQALPLIVAAGMAFATFEFFKPKVRQV